MKMQLFIPCHIPRGNQETEIWKQDFIVWVSLPCISVTMAFSAEDWSHNWKAHLTWICIQKL